MADTRKTDPPFVGRFVFEVEGRQIGAFTEVSGLGVTIDVEDVPEGGQNAYTHKLLGRMKWPNLVLKRGITDTNALFEWLMECSGDGFAKQNRVIGLPGKVSVLNSKGKPVRTWEFENAMRSSWRLR